MKKTFRNMLKLYLIGLVMLIISTVTACAKKLGADYKFYGLELGWWLIIITVIIGFLIIATALGGWLEKKIGAGVGAAVLVIFVAGLLMVSVDVETQATIVPTVSWDVEIQSASGSNVTYDDDARTITCLCHVNSTAGTILGDDDAAYTNPTINWSISPAQSTGLTDLSKGATNTVYVTNPDYQYSEDGTDYYLIAKSSGGKRDVNFTNDGSSEYESKQVTVQFGSTEYVELWIDWYDTGVATLEAGESKKISADICGEIYEITLIVTGVIT